MTEQPQLVVFGGPNGSGKSTLYYAKFANYDLSDLEYVNPDEYTKDKGSEVEGGKAAIKRRYYLIENQQSLVTETTLSGNSILRLLDSAKKADYVITLIYLCTSTPQLNIERVSQRVTRSGHHVKSEDIIRRYHSSLKNLAVVAGKVSFAHIYSSDFGVKRLFSMVDGVARSREGVDLPGWVPATITVT